MSTVTPLDLANKARFTLHAAHGNTSLPSSKLLEAALALRQSVIDHSWIELSHTASTCLGLGYASFRKLQGKAIIAGKIEPLNAQITANNIQLFQNLGKSEQLEEIIHSLRDKIDQTESHLILNRLLARRQENGTPPLPPELVEKIRSAVSTRPVDQIDFEDSIEKLSNGKTKGVSLLSAYTPQMTETTSLDADPTCQLTYACLTRGMLATAIAEFNIAIDTANHPGDSTSFENILSGAEGVVDDFRSLLRQGQQNIYSAMLNSESMSTIADRATTLAGQIEWAMPMFARSQAVIRLAMNRLRERGKGSASKKLGRVAVLAGSLTRIAIASHCACYRLGISVFDQRHPDDVASLIKKTGLLHFEAELPDGKNTALKKLNVEIEDTFIEIEGFVKNIKAFRSSDGKLISHIELVDPSNGDTGDAVAVFAHLPHAGVTKNAFCRLNGIFKSQSVLFAGKPAVEIDKLALGKLAGQSWQIAFLELADRWYQPWRNDMNVSWSLGPHGSEEDGEGFFGAGELLFTPLFRS